MNAPGILRRVGLPAIAVIAVGGVLAGCAGDPPRGLEWGISNETLSGPENSVRDSVTLWARYEGSKPVAAGDVQFGAQYYHSSGKTHHIYSSNVLSVSGDARCKLLHDQDGFGYVDCGPLAPGAQPLHPTITFYDNDANEVWIGGPKWGDSAGLSK